MQIKQIKITKATSLRDVRVTVKIYAEGVSGAVLEVERYDEICINEMAMRIKDAFRNYSDPEIKIYKSK